MSRLYDQIMRSGINKDKKALLQDAVNIDINNVVDNYYANEKWFSDEDRWLSAWSIDDFPNIAPPFEKMFVEA